jgi:hypothetical protein
MRLPLLRFTVWRMMVVVAACGVVFSLGARSCSFWRRAGYSRSKFILRCGMDAPSTPLEIAKRKRESHFIQLWEKYEFASRHPWLPVEPDPPEPE